MTAFWQDLNHGVRMLGKNPGFALVAILSIAIGVGANAAIFSLADGLILRPLPVPRPGGVVAVTGAAQGGGLNALVARFLSYPDFVDVRNRAASFESLVAERIVLTGFDARADQPALRTLGAAVSANLFDAMEIRPALGRFFRNDEDRVAGRDAVVVLDHRTWTERFGQDPGVLGRRVRITDTDFTVVGVAPASFRGLARDEWPTFYVPLAMVEQVQNPPTAELTRRDSRQLGVWGRLKPGVTVAQARHEVTSIGADLARTYPETNRAVALTVMTHFELRAQGPDANLLTMLTALALAVLVAGCANLAALFTSRAPARAHEISLRLAVGAGRFRLVRQLVTESLLIGTGGAVLGLAIAYGGIRVFQQIEFPTEVPLKLGFELDRRVLVVGMAVAIASAFLSSLVPAWQTTRVDLLTTLKGPATDRRRRQWGRSSLVCLQIAVSFVMLTIGVAIHAGFRARFAEGVGFRTDHLLMARFDDRLVRDADGRLPQFYRLLKERAAALPGVVSVSLTSAVPLKTDTSEGTGVAPEGIRLPGDARFAPARSSRVDERYFDTMNVPIVKGRAFRATDAAGTPRVAIVSEAFVRRYWPSGDAIGKRVQVASAGQSERPWVEVVGIAADSTHDFIGEAPLDFIYLPRLQSVPQQNTLLLQTTGDPLALAGPLREVAHAIEPNMPIFGIRTMADLYQARGVGVPNLIVQIIGGMGTMGLGLALVGLYGLVSYAVSRRTREIGVRMAVGASPHAVLAMVLRGGAALVAVGVVLGALVSAAAARLLQQTIPGITDWGLTPYAVVIPVMFALTLLAASVPARRAARIDPLRALRVE